MDDGILVRATLRGDLHAFERLVEANQHTLVAIARQILGHEEDAEDLAQEAFIEAFRKLRTLQDAGKFRAWLFTILRNKCVTYLHHRHPDELSLDDCSDIPVAPLPLSTDMPLQEMIMQLPVADREILAARYLQGLSYREIANALNLTEETARTRCLRARERLRALARQDQQEEQVLRQTMAAFSAGLTVSLTTQVIKEVHMLTTATSFSTAIPNATGWAGRHILTQMLITKPVLTVVSILAVTGIILLPLVHGSHQHLAFPAPHSVVVSPVKAARALQPPLVPTPPPGHQEALLTHPALAQMASVTDVTLPAPSPRERQHLASHTGESIPQRLELAQAKTGGENAPPAETKLIPDHFPMIIREVVIRGTEQSAARVQLDAKQVLATLKTGDPFSKEIDAAIISMLNHLGWFSTVNSTLEPVADGIRVVYTVKENPMVRQVTVRGFEKISPELRQTGERLLQQMIGMPFSEQYARTLEELLMAQGFFARVSHEDSRVSNSGKFTVTVVENPLVTDIAITGDLPLPKEQLLGVVQTQVGHIMNRNVVISDAAAISNILSDAGYLRVKVNETNIKNGLLTFPVLVPWIGEIRIAGNQHISIDTIQQQITCKVGDFYNENNVNDSVAAIKKLPGLGECRCVIEPMSAQKRDTGKLLLVFSLKEIAPQNP